MRNSNLPAYIQVYQQLRGNIVKGIYPFGTKLPSKRTLCTDFGLSVITIEHAISLLCEEGYTETKERSGCYVIFKQDDFQAVLPPVRNLKQNPQQIPKEDRFHFSSLAKTMRKVILDYGERLLEKSPNKGCPELREAISTYLARSRGMMVKPDQIIIGSGAEYLYGLIAQLIGKGSSIAIENPSYDQIEKVYRSFGLPCEKLTLNPDGIDSRELSQCKANILHTTPFHSYPSGISIGSSKKYEYLRWAEKENRIIVEDNYDSELTVSSKAEDSLFSMSKDENVIYLNTFSRTIAPSIRVGYMVLPEKLMKAYDVKLGFYSCTVPVYDQYVIAELLLSGSYERHINRVRRARRKATL